MLHAAMSPNLVQEQLLGRLLATVQLHLISRARNLLGHAGAEVRIRKEDLGSC